MNENKDSYIYILSNKRNGTLYIGITSDLKNRITKHKNKVSTSFTKKYNIDKLVYFEIYNDIKLVIKREKQLKKWRREWKIKLIEEKNKIWRDLYYRPLRKLGTAQNSDFSPVFS